MFKLSSGLNTKKTADFLVSYLPEMYNNSHGGDVILNLMAPNKESLHFRFGGKNVNLFFLDKDLIY